MLVLDARPLDVADGSPGINLDRDDLRRRRFTKVCADTETVRASRPWPEPVIDRIRFLGEMLAGALQRLNQEGTAHLDRGDDLQRRPSHQAAADREASADFDGIIGSSRSLQTALARLQRVAPTDCTVLLLGETGTGKELFARELHTRSLRQRNNLVSVNCAALPPTLIESELFGHERGAFTRCHRAAGLFRARPSRHAVPDETATRRSSFRRNCCASFRTASSSARLVARAKSTSGS
jgi:hypothetical protein